MRFVLALHTDDNVTYGVTVPDLPGCFSGGDTLDHALSNATEAIELHFEGLVEDNVQLPEPRPLDMHKANPDLSDAALWAVIDVDVEKLFGPAEKINITVPAAILRRIDAYAERSGETRSGFLVRAAERTMRG